MIKGIFLFLFLLSFSGLGQERAPFKLTTEQQKFLRSLPEDYTYGWVEVPEDYSKPSGQKIHVFYYGVKPSIKKSIPVLVLNGGPGDGNHGYYMRFSKSIENLNLIFMDQRGAGLSTPYPELKDENVLRYKHYLSEAIVRDSEVIRQKLFNKKKWIILGHSFGSLIAHRYIAMYPNSLDSAHAHGWGLFPKPQEIPKMRLLAHKKNLDEYLKR
ncbi:MAG: alpha/beta hydrolase, partial [Lentisphaeraceae bacterium]|nr:alpha/beta hydrolase [Lentisphaeraceae bacterium]